MAYRLDYDEPISKVIERLKREHLELKERLLYIQEEAGTRDLKVAASLLKSVKFEILRHEVEEEARVAGVIMEKARVQSQQTIDIIRYHRRVSEFLREELPQLTEQPEKKARREIREFVIELMKHNDAEESFVFPLVLSAFEPKRKEHNELS